MGLYDRVDVSEVLPDVEDDNEFQTKQFDCQLEQYEVKNGRLILHYCDPNNKLRKIDTEFHGWFSFHGFVGGKFRVWKAKFTDGKFVELKEEQGSD